MKSWTVSDKEAGGRLDKYLKVRLPEAPDSFFYKMARKKNLTINNEKCKGNEILKAGDTVKLFVSDDTIALFEGNTKEKESQTARKTTSYEEAYSKLKGIGVLKETDDLIFLYKPSGILSQKAKDNDLSLNEWLIGYLIKNKKLSEEELSTFTPSVLNRLDRNTEGIVLGSKTLRGSRFGSEVIRNGGLRKFYFCVVKGECDLNGKLEGYLWKDERSNKVCIYRNESDVPKDRANDAKYVSIDVNVLSSDTSATGRVEASLGSTANRSDLKSLLEVELHSGKSHQIRALLAEYGYPILGDHKYGARDKTNPEKKQGQYLAAVRVEFPQMNAEMNKEAEANTNAEYNESDAWKSEYSGLTVSYEPDFAKEFNV